MEIKRLKKFVKERDAALRSRNTAEFRAFLERNIASGIYGEDGKNILKMFDDMPESSKLIFMARATLMTTSAKPADRKWAEEIMMNYGRSEI